MLELWKRFPLGEIIYFIFLFSGSGNEANWGLEFHHLTSNASECQMPQKGEKWAKEESLRERSVLTLSSEFPLPTLLCAGYSGKLKIYIF